MPCQCQPSSWSSWRCSKMRMPSLSRGLTPRRSSRLPSSAISCHTRGQKMKSIHSKRTFITRAWTCCSRLQMQQIISTFRSL
ncbi:hypothetical protein ATCV1_z341L [Acanthocystis turfacea chlorella virus 1]|uniref:Uncharacterized protein z341L n=1 Tax=Chlorovirus heliozoae TaxID=322019 RepID=A7K8V1_9PHYC|nr:hypothetical protein ATCV1_z341L [Acanthocystis turfacea chlorella virus 1]ABT16475.1 hypothetical protein ATCV1_z341L [Acanthocystis turfacea chlorella virus 1]